MLIQGEPPVDQERDIVLDCHIDRVFQGVDLQDFRIGIMFSAYCIVQFQQVFLVLKQHDEQGGLVHPVDLYIRLTGTVTAVFAEFTEFAEFTVFSEFVVFISFAIFQPPLKCSAKRLAMPAARQYFLPAVLLHPRSLCC